jgi:hypothetical protein
VISAGSDVAEFRVIHKDGSIRTLKAQIELVKGSEGYPDLLMGITIDITELKQTEGLLKNQLAILKAQNEKLKEIAWLQSCKLRSPLDHLLSLAKQINYENFSDPYNEDVMFSLKTMIQQLDKIVIEINNREGVMNTKAGIC